MIALDNITLTFPDGGGRLTALDGVSLTADRGTVTGITGPSGSGKSSLLAVAATLIRPDSGGVTIGGVDASGMSRTESAALRRSSIGIVFQQANLLPSLTAREQLLVMNELGEPGSRRRRPAAAAHADELLAAVGLAEHGAKRPHQLSGGQRQRVNIARALMNDPSALLVDEPTSALDQERGAAIIELILRLTEELDTATLLVTHDLTHLPRMHDTVQLVDGRLVQLQH
ncbi:ABC transporter ATP-binding protein [Pseudoclavibacter sp. RFBJ3]|uniref:ABC transporter ATP-binding protein n=1 Tax=unclassified Pseudoclavibacter TaxID=2615177 RepID=UPI000CE7FF04|nr:MULTISPECIES: ABC transporter ATP-binding protein [unclassified Pseudoclavibacter]PPF83079.1 ABC transporter ATP-binding protein [Pseudoclavibacter sp. RFBJ5]PPF91778.1 ABC transporter ATP-binding protein [Pseudoclavibacter sp. RFBJ3]PPF96715.1 ABC transporter ATP-binding protein [Pseudoclavibacter sp. RFBH5]PPG19638.1 ABC transporter ATP-binding protein [Pseudoclavibacter sp. RFBI4]